MATAKKDSSKSENPKKSSAGSSPQDAIALLTRDHKEVKELFEAYESLEEGDDEGKLDLARNICMMLTVHATIEEKIFYPAAREMLAERDLLDEAEVEHASAKDLIAQIEDSDPGDSLFDAKVKVLSEYIEHHVKEEEGEMFPALKKAGMDTATLGEDMSNRKEELMEEMDDAAEARD